MLEQEATDPDSVFGGEEPAVVDMQGGARHFFHAQFCSRSCFGDATLVLDFFLILLLMNFSTFSTFSLLRLLFLPSRFFILPLDEFAAARPAAVAPRVLRASVLY